MLSPVARCTLHAPLSRASLTRLSLRRFRPGRAATRAVRGAGEQAQDALGGDSEQQVQADLVRRAHARDRGEIAPARLRRVRERGGAGGGGRGDGRDPWRGRREEGRWEEGWRKRRAGGGGAAGGGAWKKGGRGRREGGERGGGRLWWWRAFGPSRARAVPSLLGRRAPRALACPPPPHPRRSCAPPSCAPPSPLVWCRCPPPSPLPHPLPRADQQRA